MKALITLLICLAFSGCYNAPQQITQVKHEPIFVDSTASDMDNPAAISNLFINEEPIVNSVATIDSIANDYLEPVPKAKDVAHRQQVSNELTSTFTMNDLYPNENDRDNLHAERFQVNGIILDSQASFNHGIMKIKTNDNEELIVQFYPSECSSAVANDLLLAMKSGNKIQAVCARAGASTLDLISATVLVQ